MSLFSLELGLEFLELRFNDDIRYGNSGGPIFKTDVLTMHNGAEQRNANWVDARGKWNVAQDLYTKAQTDHIIAFFRERRGRVGGFRYKDWSDFKVPRNRGVFLDCPEKAGVLQFAIPYIAGLDTSYRLIGKPVAGTITIYKSADGSIVTPADIDYHSGLFLPTDTTLNYVWSGEFDIPVRFDVDTFQIAFEAYRETDGEALYSISGLSVSEIPVYLPNNLASVIFIPSTPSTTPPPITSGGGGTPPPVTLPTGTPVVGGTTGAAVPTGDDPSLYTLTMSDEFTGTTLNTGLWADHIWYESSDPTINYSVAGGVLSIWPAAGYVNRTIDTDAQTHTGFAQRYGFFEWEAKLPHGLGCWPAMWLINHYTDARPTIAMEAYCGGVAGGWANVSNHPVAYQVTVWGEHLENLGQKQVFTADLSAAFHKYGIKWEPNKVTFYFDGVAVYSVNVTFVEPMYLLMDLWFGSVSGTPNTTDTPVGPSNALQFNYVRAWQFI